jgi:hypothetical protein
LSRVRKRGQGPGRQKKKPWRYRWPDDFRDEVLARLLELNRHRAEQERLTGQAAAAGRKSVPRGGRKPKAKRNGPSDEPNLFE